MSDGSIINFAGTGKNEADLAKKLNTHIENTVNLSKLDEINGNCHCRVD